MDRRQKRLIELLEIIRSKISDNSNIAWTQYDSASELRQELDSLIQGIKNNDPSTYNKLSIFFAPTSDLQELSLSNGWGNEFLELASKFDSLKPIPKGRIIFGYVSGVILILFLTWTYFITKNDKEILNEKGNLTKGVVIKTNNRKRGLDVQFKFIVSGKEFISWEKVYKDIYYEGDTLTVLYYPVDPSINRLKLEKESN